MYYIGKIVNTHGIKGEVKIISKIKHKELIFKKNKEIFVNEEKLIINSYRVHKNFDMITFKNINDINDVLKYKNKSVYIEKDESLNLLFDEDYIGLEVYTDHFIGKVIDIMNNNAQDLLIIKNNEKKYYVPNIDEFIKKIDLNNKKIYLNEIQGLIDED